MSNRPKGAMGSPYVSNENGEPSVADLMGQAFDRLHENSWDGGKKQERLAKEKQEHIDKINAEFDKKLANETDIPTEEPVYSKIAEKTFSNDTKKEISNLLIENNFNISEINDERITFSSDYGKFIILPI